MIQLYNVSKKYSGDAAAAVKELTLQIGKGEFLYITGASGAGKTTLLRLLYAAEKPTRGQILIDRQNISRIRSRQIPFLRRKIGVVFQDFKLLQSRTVYENVAFALELSGGEQQRIAIARALVVDPLILLADEPSGNLDQTVTFEIMDLFKRANARGTTVLLATHDHSLNQRFPRRVLTLDQGVLVGDQQPL